jgi:hypothetical protein
MAHNFRNQPDNQSYAMTRFLLGMGPMPPPTSQELAMANLQQSLNGGMFDGADGQRYAMQQNRGLQYGGNLPPQQTMGHMLLPTGSEGSAPAQNNTPGTLRKFIHKGRASLITHRVDVPELEVHVPAAPEPESASTQATLAPAIRLAFNIDILPGDFLSRICANMNLGVGEAQLGWKSSEDLKKAAPHRLRTDDDVTASLGHFKQILSNKRRTKKVWMEIINLVSSSSLFPR